MTLFTSTYSYMDLLNDRGYVPVKHEQENGILDSLNATYETLRDEVSDYTFMDLMKDRGQVPTMEQVSFLDELEAEIVDFMDDLSDYTIIDLVREKSLIVVTVPYPANDNDALVREAS